MIVLDASVVVEMLLDMPLAQRALERIAAEATGDEPSQLFAPHLLDAEVAQVLRRLVLREELRDTRAQAALDDLERMPIVRQEHGPLIRRAWQLRHNASIYDALYLALAEQLGAVLITADRGQARIRQSQARVEWIEEPSEPRGTR
jgi:predicted nucleic acid-binding protein